MSVAGVNAASASYTNYEAKTNTAKTAAEETTKKTTGSDGAMYDQTASSDKKGTYSVAKMSSQDRAALVQQMKDDQARRQSQLLDIVRKTVSGQANRYGQANGFGQGDDGLWNILAKGDFTVDAATKEQAQKDIAEDGYYGVKQTAQRLFDFASALAGDDVDQMKKMQAAVEKGFKQAQGAWGGELPGISKDTLEAVNKMFDDYYGSKDIVTEG